MYRDCFGPHRACTLATACTTQAAGGGRRTEIEVDLMSDYPITFGRRALVSLAQSTVVEAECRSVTLVEGW